MVQRALAAVGIQAVEPIFVESRDPLPAGHRFEHDGVAYVVTQWQYRNRLNTWTIAIVPVTLVDGS